jgi:hypothetical protein
MTIKQAETSMLVTCPVCGYGLHFNCEVGATYGKSCSGCKAVISVTVDIHEQSPFTSEELKEKRNQHRG